MMGAKNFAAVPITPITAPRNVNTPLLSSTNSFNFLKTPVSAVITGVKVALKIGIK
jgi:hypothetical protein